MRYTTFYGVPFTDVLWEKIQRGWWPRAPRVDARAPRPSRPFFASRGLSSFRLVGTRHMRVLHVTLWCTAMTAITAKGAATLCDDSCKYSRDGECDDTGPSSSGMSCELGTDCTDCGKREEATLGAFMCNNDCHTGADGHCDDGGPGAKHKECAFGMDCGDCGPRLAGNNCINGRVQICGSGCMFANDGRCDDGGDGSMFFACSLGSDCGDCKPREMPCSALGKLSNSKLTQDDLSPPPPPAPKACRQSLGKGAGGAGPTAPACMEGRCDARDPERDCARCDCAACSFCTMPPATSSSPPPPPPAPSPPFQFKCSMLNGRQNLRFAGTFCYGLAVDTCESAFTYSGDVGLSLCRVLGNECSQVQVDDAGLMSSAECRAFLATPPSAPPPPPAPTPCIPLSGKCGGHDWKGLTNCCATKGGGKAQCFTKNAYHSQCRISCDVDGWECSNTALPSAAQATTAATVAPISPILRSNPPVLLTTLPPPSPKPPSSSRGGHLANAASDSPLKGQPQPPSQQQQANPSQLRQPQAGKQDRGETKKAALAEGQMEKQNAAITAYLSPPRIVLANPLGSLIIGIIGVVGGCILTYCCCVVCRVRAARTKGHTYSNTVRTTDDLEHMHPETRA